MSEVGNFRPGNPPSVPIYLWDVRSGKCTHTLRGHRSNIRYLGFSRDGTRLVSSGVDATLSWNPEDGTEDRQEFKLLPRWAVFAAGADEFFYPGDDGGVVVWNAATKRKSRALPAPTQTQDRLKFPTEALAVLSGEGRVLALGGGTGNRVINVWDFKTGKITTTLTHKDYVVSSLAMSKSGKLLFAGGNRETYLGPSVLCIWETETGRMVGEQEVGSYECRPVLALEDLVLNINTRRTPDRGDYVYRSTIEGYSLRTGKRVISFDPKLGDSSCKSAVYIESLGAICVGGDDGSITFFSLADILRSKAP